MRIIFVRHGHPDYENDCLTELGHRHAEAVAHRLCDEKIAKIYSSSCGRAVETARHIGDKLRLDIETCDFMREIRWGSYDDEPIYQGGHPWDTAAAMVAAGKSIMSTNWAKEESFYKNIVATHTHKVGMDFDRWLSSLGFEREGDFYRVCGSQYDTVVMVSHGGSSSAVLSHIFNLPFPFVCIALQPDFTAITVVTLCGEEGSLISPRFEIVNDARHIADIAVENVYDN